MIAENSTGWGGKRHKGEKKETERKGKMGLTHSTDMGGGKSCAGSDIISMIVGGIVMIHILV